MNDLINFNYEGKEVRTVTIEDEPWFVASDVCKILEYSKTSTALETNVPERHKKLLTQQDISDGNIFPSESINNRGTWIIDEPGLYRLTMRSHKKEAEKFTDFITEEVIPSIRTTGGYLGQTEELSEAEIMAKALSIANRTIEQMRDRALKAEHRAELNEQKATYCEKILQNPTLMLTSDWSKDYGFTAQMVHTWAVSKNILWKKSFKPKTPYDTMNLMQSYTYDGGTVKYKWTHNGRYYIHGKFTELGIKALEDGGTAVKNIEILTNDTNGSETDEYFESLFNF